MDSFYIKQLWFARSSMQWQISEKVSRNWKKTQIKLANKRIQVSSFSTQSVFISVWHILLEFMRQSLLYNITALFSEIKFENKVECPKVQLAT